MPAAQSGRRLFSLLVHGPARRAGEELRTGFALLRTSGVYLFRNGGRRPSTGSRTRRPDVEDSGQSEVCGDVEVRRDGEVRRDVEVGGDVEERRGARPGLRPLTGVRRGRGGVHEENCRRAPQHARAAGHPVMPEPPGTLSCLSRPAPRTCLSRRRPRDRVGASGSGRDPVIAQQGAPRVPTAPSPCRVHAPGPRHSRGRRRSGGRTGSRSTPRAPSPPGSVCR
ncbi:hypothetical protein OK006_5373 [Actinobacteria bacterium OK006]|nr:hypothetical protein OK006_5373 [Actinobacteria bacterium OK006]